LLFLTVFKLDLLMTTHTSSCSNLAWSFVRPRSWCRKIHFETKTQSQKWEIDRQCI